MFALLQKSKSLVVLFVLIFLNYYLLKGLFDLFLVLLHGMGYWGIPVFGLLIGTSQYLAYFLLKIASFCFIELFYQVKIKNKQFMVEQFKKKQSFILAPTHFTYVDAAFIFYALPWWPIRPLRLVVWYTYYFGLWTYMWLVGCIPMAYRKTPKILTYANWHIIRILSKRFLPEVVVVFPEGALNPSNSSLGVVKKGVEFWVKLLEKYGTKVEVLPVGLLVPYSSLGRNPERIFKIPQKVTIEVGRPIENCTTEALANNLAALTGFKVSSEQFVS